MKEPRHDDERLSALLEGKLDERERRELLAYLAEADEDYEVFAEAAAVLHELEAAGEVIDEPPVPAGAEAAGGQGEAEEPEGKVIPFPEPKPEPFWKRPIVRVAAVLAVLVVGYAVASRARGPASDPVRLAARLEEGGRRGLPENLDDLRSPGLMRSGDPGTPADPGQAAYAGVLLTDLAVAVRAGDDQDVRDIAGQLRGFDPGAAGSGGPLEELETRAGDSPEALGPLVRQVTERLEGRLGSDPLRLGAWAEAALLAADAHDAAFFRDGDGPALLRKAETLAAADPEAVGAVRGIRDATAGDAPPDWATVQGHAKTLIEEITQ